MLYKNKEINCTQEELDKFIVDIKSTIKYSIHGFEEKYNNVTLENKTGDINAKYYILQISNSTFFANL